MLRALNKADGFTFCIPESARRWMDKLSRALQMLLHTCSIGLHGRSLLGVREFQRPSAVERLKDQI